MITTHAEVKQTSTTDKGQGRDLCDESRLGTAQPPKTYSRVTGTDAETAHQQFSCFFQHVPNFAFSFLNQLLICLIEYKNTYFLFLLDSLIKKESHSAARRK